MVEAACPNGLYCLVNNAGMMAGGPIGTYAEALLDE
jgi:hypothetical protein